VSLYVPAIIEVPSGSINGLNKLFETSTPYQSGSVMVFLNGQLKRQDFDDGWVELGGKAFEMKEPPETEDALLVYFTPI